MRARIAATLLLAAAITLTGCGGGGGLGGGGGGGGGGTTILGVVLDDGSMLLVTGATVTAGSVTTTTGTTGQFTLTGVGQGAQTLTVTAAGHERVDVPLNVVGGQNQAGTVYLPPTRNGGRGHITGTVALASGAAVDGANVGGGGSTAKTRSDGTGRFTLYNVNVGAVQVTAQDPSTGATAWHPGTVAAGQILNIGTLFLSFGPPPPPI